MLVDGIEIRGKIKWIRKWDVGQKSNSFFEMKKKGFFKPWDISHGFLSLPT